MNKLIALAFSSILLIGCAVVPKEIASIEKEKGITLYRQNIVSGAAATLFVEINDEKYSVGPGEVIHVKPKVGINTFMLVGYRLYSANEEIKLKRNKFNLEYSKEQVIRLGVGLSEPTTVEILKHSGEIVRKYKLEFVNTKHNITATPGNVVISYQQTDKGDEKILYDYSGGSNSRDTRIFPIIFNSYPYENMEYKIKVKWKEFDDEVVYSLVPDGGIDTEKQVVPSRTSKKYLGYLSSQIFGEKRIEFVCSYGLNEKFPDYQQCIKFERNQVELEERKSKEIQYKLEVKNKITTKEGEICEKKFKGFENKDAFLKCYWEETEKSFNIKKFSDALKSNEGKVCAKKSSKDNEVFWECYKQEVANKEKLNSDSIAQQCVAMGFEYMKSGYSECYLKLKIHVEQIAEWKKMQSAIESRPNVATVINSSTSISDDVGRNLDIARQGFDSAFGSGSQRVTPSAPPMPARIITPMGNSYNCTMMGAALRCR